MPLESDVSVVLIIQVNPLVGGSGGPHHGDETRGVGALLAVDGLTLVPSSDCLKESAHVATCSARPNGTWTARTHSHKIQSHLPYRLVSFSVQHVTVYEMSEKLCRGRTGQSGHREFYNAGSDTSLLLCHACCLTLSKKRRVEKFGV